MTQAPTDLAIIIPHYADLARLERCLVALVAQDLDGCEVVVADNATPGGLNGLEARFPGVRFVTQPEKGAAAARNKGVQETTAPGLAFLDADCVPAPTWVSRAKRASSDIMGAKRASSQIMDTPDTAIGGRVTVFDETPAPRSGAEAFETVFAFDQESYIRDKGFSVTANLVTTRALFDRVGPFRPGVSEDLDWCQRAVGQGAALRYDPELTVSHPTRQDWPALAKKWRRTTQEAYLLHKASGTGLAGWLLKALAMPLSALAHAPRVLRHPDLRGSERLAGLGALVRLRCARMIWMIQLASGRRLH